ncbi:hypothetical protein F4809DRAFT_647048 [Biscogniauxia mediterranea]|nr:hypothetical protein F4809DRAFT_647048 [Biscogniauxia mediterranea]
MTTTEEMVIRRDARDGDDAEPGTSQRPRDSLSLKHNRRSSSDSTRPTVALSPAPLKSPGPLAIAGTRLHIRKFHPILVMVAAVDIIARAEDALGAARMGVRDSYATDGVQRTFSDEDSLPLVIKTPCLGRLGRQISETHSAESCLARYSESRTWY